MRILHILDHSIPLQSGYTFRTRNILQQQRAIGWETFHLTGPKQGDVEVLQEEIDGLEFYRTPQLNGYSATMPMVNQFAIVPAIQRRLNDIIDEVQPDILHAHSPSLNGLAALKVSRRRKLPLVYEVRAFWEDAAVDHGTSTEWGLRYRLTRASETLVLKNAQAVTTICEGLRNEMIGRGIPNEKITVIPNAVDIDKFIGNHRLDENLRTSLGLDGKRVLGFLGSFYAYEGLALLIEAMPSILQAAPDVRLLLVGGGPQDGNLKEQAERLGLQNQVIFTGRVPHDQVQKYYNLVDVLVYPRLSMRLTDLVTPLKPLEAMAQEKLLVASDVGGHQELISDGKTGFLFASDDARALTDRVLDMLNAEGQWSSIRASGRQFVETERNWGSSVANYEAVYSSLIGRG